MDLCCSDQPHLGPPPIPSAQGLHCSSVPARVTLWMCLSLAPAVLQSCLAMRPVDLAGSWPVDSAPGLTLDLPCQYGLAWWSWEWVWLWLPLSDLAWPWLDDLHVRLDFEPTLSPQTARDYRRPHASEVQGSSLSWKGRGASTIWPSLCPFCEETMSDGAKHCYFDQPVYMNLLLSLILAHPKNPG